MILSTGSGPGGRRFKSFRPDHFISRPHIDLHCNCFLLFDAQNLSRLVNHRLLFAGRKYKTKTYLGYALSPPMDVVEQLLAVAPRHFSVRVSHPITNVHSILTPANQVPSIGKPQGRFNGNFGSVVRRPLVVVSEPYFNDPDHWVAKEPSPQAMTEVRESFRKTFRHVRQCDALGEALKEDWKILDSEIVVSKSYGSRKREFLVETKVLHNRCLFNADGDDFQSLGGNQVFYVPPDHGAVFLGLQWEMVDAGDYDGDGKSEVIFYVAEGKDVDVETEGYVLFYDDFRHSVRFVWQNH